MRSLEERKEIAAQMPWILRRRTTVPCDGIKWSGVSMRDLSTWGVGNSNEPRGIQDKAKCKLSAEWHYMFLGRHLISNGNRVRAADFCWHHMILEMFDGHEEEARVQEWLKANVPDQPTEQ